MRRGRLVEFFQPIASQSPEVPVSALNHIPDYHEFGLRSWATLTSLSRSDSFLLNYSFPSSPRRTSTFSHCYQHELSTQLASRNNPPAIRVLTVELLPHYGSTRRDARTGLFHTAKPPQLHLALLQLFLRVTQAQRKRREWSCCRNYGSSY